jgi:hypothetical protein
MDYNRIAEEWWEKYKHSPSFINDATKGIEKSLLFVHEVIDLSKTRDIAEGPFIASLLLAIELLRAERTDKEDFDSWASAAQAASRDIAEEILDRKRAAK